MTERDSAPKALQAAEARAANAERRLKAVIDALPEGVVLLDQDRRYVLWNERYSQIYHRSADLFATGVRLMDTLRVGVERGDYPEAAGREEDWLAEREQRLLTPRHRQEQQLSDGSWMMIEDRLTDDGGLIGLRVDITDMKHQAAELKRVAAEAEAANLAKSEFLANISHEIRTPLHGMLGMAQILERDSLSDDQRRRLGVIRQSGDRLLALVNDLLDFAKIEAGKLDVEMVDYWLPGAVEAACAPFQPLAEAKGLALEVHVDAALRGYWRGDPMRLQQVVANLVSNAVKFTLSGGVTVTAGPTADGMVLSVEDTGIGVSPGRIGEIFQKFVQAETTNARRFGGTGLGLAISRQLAELMGGELSATSQEGRGSCFRLALPMRPGRQPAPPTRSAGTPPCVGPGEGVRILAAEDNPINQQILCALLEPLGVALTLVGNGREAIAAFARGGFDLVLMDIQMPELDGVAATRGIRDFERENRWPATPIIALSANAMVHQVAEYRAAGMDDLVSKPFEAGRLFAVLQAHLMRAPDRAETAWSEA